MAEIRILAAENSRSKQGNRQTLQFWLAVENLTYHKQVEIFWAGADGVWQVLAAEFRSRHGDNQEYWHAHLSLSGRSGLTLPGSIKFAARVTANDIEHWDNNEGRNHFLHSAAGIVLFNDQPLQNLTLQTVLDDDKHFQPLKIAVASHLRAERLEILYSHDNWRSSHRLHCKHSRSSKLAASQIWTARLDIAPAFAVQYCICAYVGEQRIWDNNGGLNYQLSHRPLSVMILNLHCYQEDNQADKFRQIAKAIDQQGVDVVCLQEVAEHWNDGYGDWASNSANIINQLLKKPMQLYSDWSHLGFDKYREGVAILSRHPLHHCQSRYVSDSHDVYSINSRKVVMAQIDIAYLGKINVFSAHLSWWEGGFQQQFQRLSDWAAELADETINATLLCGDFNIAAGSIGYRQVVEAGQYEDQYLAVNHQGLFQQIFRVNDSHWGDSLADDYRIDYIFLNKDAGLQATSARVMFTEADYGQVSDHCGYLMQFAPRV